MGDNGWCSGLWWRLAEHCVARQSSLKRLAKTKAQLWSFRNANDMIKVESYPSQGRELDIWWTVKGRASCLI